MSNLKERLFNYYEANELRVDMAFFLGGFIFDIFTLSGVDDLFSITQQIVYLVLIGIILSAELISSPIPPKLQKIWDYRSAITHFLLGSLLSVYSLFFLKSASIFNSIVFVALLMLVMVANELKNVQSSGVNTKIALYVICLFSFFSLLIPTLLGFVGWIPFLLTTAMTSLIL
ncbi:MAG: hypothetical protein K2P81_09135 [Bacteriovoracaceae bacterium]|nr:hypothetical protein [Bacteriovoracaceae bacterium]